jgi:hypothetical protein
MTGDWGRECDETGNFKFVYVNIESASDESCTKPKYPAGRIKVYHLACSSRLLHPLGAPAFGDWDHRRENGTERDIVYVELDGM